MIDRDGTINVEKHYLSDPDQLELIPGVAAGIRALKAAGLGVCVVTNQSGIARGYFDLAGLAKIHDRLRALLAADGAEIEGIYLCQHGPDDDCACRKPLPGDPLPMLIFPVKPGLPVVNSHAFPPPLESRMFSVPDPESVPL